MATVSIEYLGDLRTKCTHLKSGNTVITDAPTDNNGRGENFSPTDLVATAYISCMMTIVGIYCDKNNIPFHTATGSVLKTMAGGPRRVAGLTIQLDFSGNNWNLEIQQNVIAAAEACPVAKSVHGDIELTFEYTF